MSILLQILLFGVPGLLVYYGTFYGTPKLVKKGVPLVYAFWSWLWLPVLLLLPLSIMLFVVFEGGSLRIDMIVERFRLIPLTKGDWLWVGVAILATIVLDQLLEPIGKFLARIKGLAPPAYLPAPFHPLKRFSIPPKEFFGVPLKGNWKLLMVFIPLHILAMFSEEMMWRGFLLPIQETMFGEFAWVVNGLLWAWLLHMALKWHFVGMLPSMLIAPFIAQYTGSTWASFAVHAIGNSPLWIILLIGVIGSSGDKNKAENSSNNRLDY